jgi:hypothetical protein
MQIHLNLTHQHAKKQHYGKAKQPYSIRIAGPPSLNSANDAFLNPALTSSLSIPTSFVQIHVEAYIFTLHTLAVTHLPISNWE